MRQVSITKRVKVWDGATRLFHWLLVILVGLSWISGENGWIAVHLYSGCSIGALLLFRLGWGVFGSETARFARMLASPGRALGHLRRLRVREADDAVGHNPAGGWSVALMLALLVTQVLTGLGANDDVSFEGPFAKYAGKDASDTLTGLHFRIFTIIQIAVVLHVLAILLYRLLKGQNLLGPMLHGHKDLPAGTPAPAMAPARRAWLVLAIGAAAMAWVAFRL